MKDRPILFNADMVRAILRGAKTQTRRPVKPQRWLSDAPCRFAVRDGSFFDPDGNDYRSPFGAPGDRLYVRETWCRHNRDLSGVVYRADLASEEVSLRAERNANGSVLWRPSIHMPKWAARIWLKVERVWVERVQDISEEDAQAEGFERWTCGKPSHSHQGDTVRWHRRVGGRDLAELPCGYVANPRHRDAFMETWQSIYGTWEDNPWVWCCGFSVLSVTGEPT